jgi:two-component system cell cycle sensor histidine kinase/response regulator CckA
LNAEVDAWVDAEGASFLSAYLDLHERRFDEITDQVAPLAHALMPGGPEPGSAEADRLRQESRKQITLYRAGLASRDFSAVDAYFEARGRMFATYGMSIDAWSELVQRSWEICIPMLVAEHGSEPRRLSGVLAAMLKFWRRAVHVARRTYTVTAAQLAEEQRRALRRSETRYSRLIESGIVGTMIADTTGRILEANDAFLFMLDYSREELEAGKLRWDELTPPEWEHVSKLALAELEQFGVAFPREKRYRRRDGSLVPVMVGVAALDPPETITFVLDLTERQRLEEQLRQSQKLEAIGSLAGGIAHDFNNLLSVILSNCDLLLDEFAGDQGQRLELEEIRRAGERAAALTAQLLAFSRKQILRPRVVEIAEVVQGMEPLMQRLVGSPIELSVRLASDPGRVFADPHQLEQVLMNLVVNARDAMPKGGRLSIELELRQLVREEAEVLGVLPGAHVVLRVSDTGEGMDATTRSRVFEPFFSTKGERGTGLGLSTVFGIVRQHEGAIAIDSEPGRGTTFTVFLPWTDRETESKTPSPARADLRGGETILLVEDEDDVRRIICQVLSRSGYRVLDAPHGEAALDLIQRHQGTIDLLLTDLIMPKMDGRELAERVCKTWPKMRVLFMSGYAADGPFGSGQLAASAAFLQKPITPQALLEGIRKALDAGDAALRAGA